MTVVPLRPLVFRATVAEKDLAQLKAGQAAKITPVAAPQQKLRATVEHVAALPDPSGKFVVRLKLDDAAALPEILAPGMDGNVKVVTRNQPDALLVPAKSVFPNEQDDERFYVFVVKDGQNAKRDVSLGYRGDDQVEITSGLTEGEMILLERPQS
jgi:RND family efflux transporter MFP subunit